MKAPWYEQLVLRGTLVSLTRSKEHAARRKHFSNAFCQQNKLEWESRKHVAARGGNGIFPSQNHSLEFWCSQDHVPGFKWKIPLSLLICIRNYRSCCLIWQYDRINRALKRILLWNSIRGSCNYEDFRLLGICLPSNLLSITFPRNRPYKARFPIPKTDTKLIETCTLWLCDCA